MSYQPNTFEIPWKSKKVTDFIIIKLTSCYVPNNKTLLFLHITRPWGEEVLPEFPKIIINNEVISAGWKWMCYKKSALLFKTLYSNSNLKLKNKQTKSKKRSRYSRNSEWHVSWDLQIQAAAILWWVSTRKEKGR